MKSTLAILSVLAANSLATAQDSYWIANRASSDIMRVSAWGSVLERVPTATTLRSFSLAPCAQVWRVRFIHSPFGIYHPATGATTRVTLRGGCVYRITFDSAVLGCVTDGSSTACEFDANGVPVTSYALTSTASL